MSDAFSLIISDRWKATYPGAAVGLLVMRDVQNPEQHAELDQHKQTLEAEIRARFAGADKGTFKALPSIQPYIAYYKRFNKSYHVQLQLESVALKGKSIPRVAALVEAMFMAELRSHMLTAGNDFSLVQPPLRLDIATGHERFVPLNGQETVCKPNDMLLADAQGILSSIIGGQDQRTRITAQTRHVLFTTYTPAGIDHAALAQHLAEIQRYVMLIAPTAQTDLLHVYTAVG